VPPQHQRRKPSDWFSGSGTLSGASPQITAHPRVIARPRVIAHRGASGHAPENTLSAFLLASEMGAEAIELDVHLAADGEVVVIHNDTVDATTDGHGRVSQMTLDELKALDAGGWYDVRYAGERIPTLAEVFEAVGHRLLINVEIKVERGLGATRARQSGQLEVEVIRLIEDYQMTRRVILSSFSPGSLRRAHRLHPNIPLGFLYARSPRRSPLLMPRIVHTLVVPYDALHPALSLVDAAYVAGARRWGPPVNVWTVNAPDDMRRVSALGVAGIITNYPDRLNQVLAERPGLPGD
jgi:glycerophosphoryl diester phosphodiesterase